jgi:hypothetical protein
MTNFVRLGLFFTMRGCQPYAKPKLEDHSLSAVRGYIFNIFAVTLYSWRQSPSSVTQGRAMLWWQGTHLTWEYYSILSSPFWLQTYGTKLTLKEVHRLKVFENRAMRIIFRPERDEVTGGWRKLHDEELHNLQSSQNITRIIMSRRMK